jgi:predicted DNA-binding transcriptional regulator AlpA
MPTSADKNLISSKEVLEITGISRATLNNYIKMGIIPRPIVKRPRKGMVGVKKIGYFPRGVLERLETVKRLKREGQSMEDIATGLRAVPLEAEKGDWIKYEAFPPPAAAPEPEPPSQIPDKGLRLTLEDIPFPAYLLNYNFEIEWVNKRAEDRIFGQVISRIREMESRNIFRVLFNWELHSHVRNWKDLITFHMSFAKSKFSKPWIERLYNGISNREVDFLEEIYDKVSTSPKQGIKQTDMSLLMEDGSTLLYKVYSIFFKEGIFFIYAPRGSDRLPLEPVELFISRGLRFSTMRDSRGFPSNAKSEEKKPRAKSVKEAGKPSSDTNMETPNGNGGGENGPE